MIERRSKHDRIQPLQAKLAEYRADGYRMGWLINVQDRQVEIYRPDREPETLKAPPTLLEEAVMPDVAVATTGRW